jgi:hypothetical protein
MDNPSFAERTVALKDTAMQLKTCAEAVLREAQRMEAAQIRFTERVGGRRSFRRRVPQNA